MINKAIYRTAPATAGLLKKFNFSGFFEENLTFQEVPRFAVK